MSKSKLEDSSSENSAVLTIVPVKAVSIEIDAATEDRAKKENELLEYWLSSKATTTRKGYLADLRSYAKVMSQNPFDLLYMEEWDVCRSLEQYKAIQREQGIKSNTINRRLAALQGLFKVARYARVTTVNPSAVKTEPVVKYRDTTGLNKEQMIAVFQQIDCHTEQGKRDLVIFKLFLEHGLRRSELAKIKVKDLDLESSRLRIYGKGKGDNETWIYFGRSTKEALVDWLALGKCSEYLLVPLMNGQGAKFLSTQSLYNLVVKYCRQAGIKKTISPHRLRHSAITLALDVMEGDLRKVQKFSRHAKIETLMIYDDSRVNFQAEVSAKLEGALRI